MACGWMSHAAIPASRPPARARMGPTANCGFCRHRQFWTWTAGLIVCFWSPAGEGLVVVLGERVSVSARWAKAYWLMVGTHIGS